MLRQNIGKFLEITIYIIIDVCTLYLEFKVHTQKDEIDMMRQLKNEKHSEANNEVKLFSYMYSSKFFIGILLMFYKSLFHLYLF